MVDNLTAIGCMYSESGGAYLDQAGENNTIINSVFRNNYAVCEWCRGGAIFSLTCVNSNLTNNTFTNNTAPEGGGYHIRLGKTAILEDNFFEYNHATKSGGAMYIATGCDNVIVRNNSFDVNWSLNGGGFFTEFSNNVFYKDNKFLNNWSTKLGGALSILNSNNVSFEGDIFKNNTATISGGAIDSQVNVNFTMKKVTC